MRPRLASLALLLLALCRPSSADDQMTPEQALAMATKFEQEHAGWQDLQALQIAVNFFAESKTLDNDEKPMIHTGVICAFEEYPNENLADKIKQIMYATEAPDPQKENAIANSMGVKCDTTDDSLKARPEWKCFCKDPKKIIVYCIAEKLKKQIEAEGFQKTSICPKAALAALKNAGTKTMGKYHDYMELRSHADRVKYMQSLNLYIKQKNFAKITNNEDAEMAKLYCDAIDPSVVSAVKTLHNSDYFYAYFELFMEMTQANSQMVEMEKKCQNREALNDPGVKCFCDKDKGTTFCGFHAAGNLFEKLGYLSCSGAEKKFDKTKRPGAPSKEIKEKEKYSDHDLTPGRPGRHDDSSTATPSSLLLAPLSAAAAMLLLRH